MVGLDSASFDNHMNYKDKVTKQTSFNGKVG
ncbi:MAG: hypothetical protein ACJAQ2_001675 [Vicingaceae bacterium]|jgi:hypothetical protein